MIGSSLKVGLWAELAKRPELFEEARARHAALAEHSTLASVLGVLNDERPEACAAKDALTRAMLQEYRATLIGRAPNAPTSPYWTTLLLAAFWPMLRRLRGSIGPAGVGRDDLDQIVVEVFLATARAIPFRERDSRLAVRLKSRTRRKVFQRVRAERRDYQERERLAADVEVHGNLAGIGARPPKGKVRFPPSDRESLAQALIHHAGSSVEQSQLDLLIATYVRGERLRTIVQRQHPEMSAIEQDRIYERLKRAHSRTLARLQKVLQGADFPVPDRQPPGSASGEAMDTSDQQEALR
jgi:hypothetical protein